ncbi:MAG: hypothetical protein ACP5SI_05515 [Chloroflexia bacterium]
MTDRTPFEDATGAQWPSGVAIARAYAAQRDHFLRLYERAVRSEAPSPAIPEDKDEPEPPSPVSAEPTHTGCSFPKAGYAPFRRTRL